MSVHAVLTGLIIPRGGGPVGLPLNRGPFNARTEETSPHPSALAFHLQSKSKTQGARESHQRAF